MDKYHMQRKVSFSTILISCLLFVCCSGNEEKPLQKYENGTIGEISSSNDPILIASNAIDRLVIGMDSLEVFEAYDSLDVFTDSGVDPLNDSFYSVLIVPFDEKNKIIATLDEGKILYLHAYGARFETQFGITNGSTFHKIKTQVKRYAIVPGEELGPPFVVIDAGISFELSGNDTWYNRDYSNADYERFITPDSKVQKILVWSKE